MHRPLRCVLLSLLFAWLPVRGFAAIPAPVAEALARQGIPVEAVGLWVQSVGATDPEAVHQPDRPLNPASVMKLVTSYAAFDVLGPTYTWKTRVLADAPPRGGVLDGNLYIVGEGDPALTVERLWRMLHGLRLQGLQRIRGNLVLDHSAWGLPAHDPAAFDGRGTRPYNVGPDALLVNFAALKLSFEPVPGGAPRLRSDPPLDGISVVSALVSRGGPCGDWEDRLDVELLQPGSRPVIRVTGEWRDSCGPRDWFVAPLAPDVYARAAVAGMWKEVGGRLDGRVFHGVTPGEAQLLAVETSPTLAEVARDMNKWSNNVQARHLQVTLGVAAGGEPDPVAAGGRVLAERLAAAGIDPAALVADNGSGLARGAAISARALGRLLDRVFAQPWMPEYLASLSLAGLDGTARRRLADGPVRGRAHLKTGSIDGARAIAGYLLDRNGRRHIVVMLVNDPRAWASVPAQDALLGWVWQGAEQGGPAR